MGNNVRKTTVESEPLGTGGAMKFALAKARERQLIVLNGDTYADVDLNNLMCRFESARTDLAIAVTYLNDIARYGAIVIEEKSQRIKVFARAGADGAGRAHRVPLCGRGDIHASGQIRTRKRERSSGK
jgi:NDP-sugar pyrophosphorylase family protein